MTGLSDRALCSVKSVTGLSDRALCPVKSATSLSDRALCPVKSVTGLSDRALCTEALLNSFRYSDIQHYQILESVVFGSDASC